MIIQATFAYGFHGSTPYNMKKPEWPPTPSRLFKAIISTACNYSRAYPESLSWEKCINLLEWFESTPLPNIYFEKEDEFSNPPLTYVPNNEKGKKERKNQARFFPRHFPSHPSIYYEWNEEKRSDNWNLLAEILTCMDRLGTARSILNSVVILDSLPAPAKSLTKIIPALGGDYALNPYYPGMFEELEIAYKQKSNKLPKIHHVGYEEFTTEEQVVLPRIFDKFITFEIKGPYRPYISNAAMVAHQMRGELLKICNIKGIKAPPSLSGQDKELHMAFLPLTYVGSDYANGDIFGVGVAVPKYDAEIDNILADVKELCDTENKDRWILSRPYGTSVNTLRPSTWTKASKEWVSITPLELSWEGYNKHDLHATHEAMTHHVKKHCKLLGLPDVEEIIVSNTPMISGSLPANKTRSRNRIMNKQAGFLIHSKIQFCTEIRGPLVVGRGGTFGLGCMIPLADVSACK